MCFKLILILQNSEKLDNTNLLSLVTMAVSTNNFSFILREICYMGENGLGVPRFLILTLTYPSLSST